MAVGVIVWLSSELMFFAGLFAAYFTLRAASARWPPAGVSLTTVRTGAATAVLVASSFTMHGAGRAAQAGDRPRVRRFLAATAVLGVIFLSNQALEWAQASFSISSHAYGSMFFLMTGFHGLHVLGGIVFMTATAAMVSGAGSRAPLARTVEVCGYYWHFVDAVWVAMYLTIYVLR